MAYHLKILETPLFVHQLVQAKYNLKKSINVLHYWSFVRGIHQSQVDSPYNEPAIQKTFLHHDIIMDGKLHCSIILYECIQEKNLESGFTFCTSLLGPSENWSVNCKLLTKHTLWKTHEGKICEESHLNNCSVEWNIVSRARSQYKDRLICVWRFPC